MRWVYLTAALSSVACLPTVPRQSHQEAVRLAIAPFNPVIDETDGGFRVSLGDDEERQHIYIDRITSANKVAGVLPFHDLNEPRIHDTFQFAILDSTFEDSSASPEAVAHAESALRSIAAEAQSLSFIAHLAVPLKQGAATSLFVDIESLAAKLPYQVTPASYTPGSHLSREMSYVSHDNYWRMTPDGTSQSYSFNYGSTHVVMLESFSDDSLEQANWLVRDLVHTSRNRTPWVVVMVPGSLAAKKDAEAWSEYEDIFRGQGVSLVVMPGSDTAGEWTRVTVRGTEELIVESMAGTEPVASRSVTDRYLNY